MKRLFPLTLLALTAQAAPPALSPGEIVTASPASDWVTIAPSDLLVMDLASDSKNRPRRVVIQLMPPPFSQGWVGNIRLLAKARWWDGTSINRVQDNYVVQWGDASEKKAVPADLVKVLESAYSSSIQSLQRGVAEMIGRQTGVNGRNQTKVGFIGRPIPPDDPYGGTSENRLGWPTNRSATNVWPVHCYGMVGVGRGMPPDTGSGAELYTVIGHAPRHLDRNIALVGRVIEGIEHLSSLPRGTGALGFYEKAEERVPIRSIRLASDLPRSADLKFEYLLTESESFARYADARANRRDAFFISPAGGADICNIPVPVRRAR